MQGKENRQNKQKAKIKQQVEPKSNKMTRKAIFTRTQNGYKIFHQLSSNSHRKASKRPQKEQRKQTEPELAN
jgi:hypothetical protein